MTSLTEHVYPSGNKQSPINSTFRFNSILFFAMDFKGNLEMVNAGCFKPKEPLNTQFLLLEDVKNNPCPKFYGKMEDKKKVYHALKEVIHREVHAKWGQLKCHCQMIPKMRLSKTARNLNKVFLTCGAPAYPSESRCKYFQWIHTPLFTGRRSYKPLKSATKQTQTEWLQQAKQNVEQWKCEQANKAWLNQFAETTRKQEQQWQAKNKEVLPSTFHWSPQIAEMYKKQDQWKEIHSLANDEFAACMNRKNSSEAEQTEKKQSNGFWPQNDASIAEFVNGPWPFGDLPEKVCSLASYCRRRKQQGLPLTPAQERFFSTIS